LSFLLCLCLFFNKITEKGRTGPAWKGRGERGEGWGRGHRGEMTQTMYAHVNKLIIIKENPICYLSGNTGALRQSTIFELLYIVRSTMSVELSFGDNLDYIIWSNIAMSNLTVSGNGLGSFS
jgi:hypothetical protein